MSAGAREQWGASASLLRASAARCAGALRLRCVGASPLLRVAPSVTAGARAGTLTSATYSTPGQFNPPDLACAPGAGLINGPTVTVTQSGLQVRRQTATRIAVCARRCDLCVSQCGSRAQCDMRSRMRAPAAAPARGACVGAVQTTAFTGAYVDPAMSATYNMMVTGMALDMVLTGVEGDNYHLTFSGLSFCLLITNDGSGVRFTLAQVRVAGLTCVTSSFGIWYMVLCPRARRVLVDLSGCWT